MTKYEYKVVPAPRKGVRAKGIKGAQARFAHALELTMNEMAAKGWEYVRSDAMSVEQRKGLTGRTTVVQNVLVFRRAKSAGHSQHAEPPLSRAEPAARSRASNDATRHVRELFGRYEEVSPQNGDVAAR